MSGTFEPNSKGPSGGPIWARVAAGLHRTMSHPEVGGRRGLSARPGRDESMAIVSATTPRMLELDDIQSGALHPRPSPYIGVYVLVRIDNRRAGREMLRRLIPALANATNPLDPSQQAWVSAGFTFEGLKALGVPQDSLDSFPLPFQQLTINEKAELVVQDAAAYQRLLSSSERTKPLAGKGRA
jgi:hypothetical protein